MKKDMLGKWILLYMIFVLTGCTNDNKKLTHINYKAVRISEPTELTITNKETLIKIEEIFRKNIRWTNARAEMTNEPNVQATLFYTEDTDTNEQIHTYLIWFSGKNAVIVGDNGKQGYGIIDLNESLELEDLFVLQ